MAMQHVALNDAWADFQEAKGDGEPANMTATDLLHILGAVEIPIVFMRPDLRVGFFNAAAADVLGLSPLDVGRACRDAGPLAGLHQLEQQCRRVIADGVESRADFRVGDAWFVVRISPCTNGDRQVTGAVLTFTNVTAFRASLEQAVFERESTKAILNTVADPLVVLSVDQRIQSANRAFYTMFGVSRDETQGVALYEFGNGAFERAALQTRLIEMLAGRQAFEPVEVDQVLTAKGPRTLILDVRSLSLPAHSEQRVLVTFQDITARKQAEAAKDMRSEEELRRSEALLAEAQRLSLTGSFSWRPAIYEMSWSEQLYRTFEFDQGKPFTPEQVRSRIHPEDLPLFNEMMDRSRGALNDFDFECRLLMPDQSVKYLRAIAHGSRNKDGELVYLGAAQDVTQQRLSEKALAETRSEMARVTRVMSLGALAAAIAHEVNQPLSGILTNAGACLRMLAADPPNVERARETTSRIIRDGNRASEVITRLRALFGNKESTIESVDLNEAAREVIALSFDRLQRDRVLLRTELEDGLPLVAGDRVQLQQVILNLVQNASDAMRDVDDRPRLLVIRSEREGSDYVRMAVQDAGVGFDGESAARLFAAFYTTKSDGMGIGLPLSRSIVEKHRGRLWATRNEGWGATFLFSIPCNRESAAL